MKNIMRILTLLLALVFVFTCFVGCESGDDVEEDNKTLDLPSWFLSPPIADDALYAIGVGESSKLQMAMNKASDWARQELSRVISVKVSTMTKQFLEEAGVDDVSQTTEFTEVVSKSIASNSISGSKIKEQEIKETDDGKYIAYCLVELKLADMTGAIDEIVKQNSAAFAKLQANRAFDDLANELKELDSNSYETPATPEY